MSSSVPGCTEPDLEEDSDFVETGPRVSELGVVRPVSAPLLLLLKVSLRKTHSVGTLFDQNGMDSLLG